MKKSLIYGALKVAAGISLLGSLLSASTILAAANPSGTGQPKAECGDENAIMEPNGFSSGGFAKAEAVYAGSDGSASASHAQSVHAISQYDVACYQLTSNR